MVSKKDNRFLLFLVISLSLSLSLNFSAPFSNKNFKNFLLGYSLAWHDAATHTFCFKISLIFYLGVGGWGWGWVRWGEGE